MALSKKLFKAAYQQDYNTLATELFRQDTSADPQITTDKYQNLLYQACCDGQLEFIELLVTNFHVIPGISCIHTAIKKKHINIINYLVTDGGCKPTTEHLATAILIGHIGIVKCLVEGGCRPKTEHLVAAIQMGTFDIVRYLVTDCGCKQTSEHLLIAILEVECLDSLTTDTALVTGHLDIVKWLLVDGGCKPNSDHLGAAIQCGHFDIVKCLVTDGRCKPVTEHLDTAVQRQHFDIVKCLVVDGGYKPTSDHLDAAIKCGHFNIVKCLIVDGGCKPVTEHLDSAVQRRHIEIVKYLVYDCECKPTLHTAILWGHLNTVKELVINHGYKPITEHLNTAFCELLVCNTSDYFDIVKCLVDGGCKPTTEHLDTAIFRGHINIMKYLVDSGCKLTTEHLGTAIQRGHFNIVKYLVVFGGCKPLSKHLDSAVLRRHLEIVKYLLAYCGCKPTLHTAILWGCFNTVSDLVVNHGCKPTTEHLNIALWELLIFSAANWRNYFDIVKCLVINGECKPTAEHLHTVIQKGHFDIVKYLFVDGGCKPTTQHLLTAVQRGCFDIVKYIIVSSGCKPTTEHLDTAVLWRHLEIVKYLVDDCGCKPNLHTAILLGHLDTVKYLVSCSYKPTTEHLNVAFCELLACNTADQKNYTDIVKCLVVDGGCKPTTDHLHAAIQRGYFDIVKYLVVVSECELSTKHFDVVIQRGHFDIFKYLVDSGCKPATEHLDTAVQNGHFDIVKCLLDGGCKPTTEHLHTAIKRGYFGIVKCLGGCKPTTKHLKTATLELKKWLDSPITTENFTYLVQWLVVACGSKLTTEHHGTAILELKEWLDSSTTENFDTAIDFFVKWLVNACGWKPTTRHYDIAILELKEWLDCPTTQNFDAAISLRRLDIVKCLVDGGCKPTTEHLDAAIERGHLDIVKYLVVDGGCKPTTEHLDTAIQGGLFLIVVGLAVDYINLFMQKGIAEHFDSAIQQQWRYLDIIKCLVVDGECKPTTENLDTAIRGGHLDFVKWLVIDGKCKPTTKNLNTAIQWRFLFIEGLLNSNDDQEESLYSSDEEEGGLDSSDNEEESSTSNDDDKEESSTSDDDEEEKNSTSNDDDEEEESPDCNDEHKEGAKHLLTSMQQQYKHLDIIGYLVDICGCQPTIGNLNTALQKGDLDIVKCLVVCDKCKPTNKHLDIAIHEERLGIVQCLVDGGCKPTTKHLELAIQKEHFDIVKCLVVDGGCKPNTEHLDTAIQNSQFNIVKCLVVDGGCKPNSKHLDTAIQNSQFNIVKCLVVDGRCKTNSEHLSIAIQIKRSMGILNFRHFNIVKCLVVNGGCKPTTEHLNTAIQEENLDIVRYLVHGGCKPTTKHLATAILKGQFDIVKWLVTAGGSKPTTEHLGTAILRGHFDILKFLVVYGGCKPSTELLDTAFQRGHFDIVKFLVVTGECKPSTEHLHTAIELGYFDIVKCLVVDGGSKPTTEHLAAAILRGRLDTVRYLVVDGGCKPTTEHLGTAILRSHFDIVKCLVVDGGCKPTVENLHIAIQKRHSDTVKCLVVDGKCKPTTEHLSTAFNILLQIVYVTTQRKYLDILKCLVVDGACNLTAEHLDVLIQKRRDDIVKYLVASGWTATTELLDTAIQRKHFQTVKSLVVDGRCKPTIKQLYIAIQKDANEIAKVLISSKSIDLTSQVGPNQRNVLHVSCTAGKLGIVEHLIKDGRCNIREKDGDGNTALHLACYYDHYHIVKTILHTGKCDVSIRNMDNSTPLDLSNNAEVIRELIKYGANPSNVYKRFGSVFGNSPRQAIKACVKVFVTGDPSGGKSTLTKSLQKETSALARIFSRAKKVSDVDEKTAGIIPYEFESKKYGSVTFYDLAGQREFYSSHAAVLSSTICSFPPIFLLVIDLQRKSEEELKQSILFWLSFLENQCSSVKGKPHLIVIGSHADILKSRGEDPEQKSSIVRDTLGIEGEDNDSMWFKFFGFIPMDCQYPQSSEIDRLRHQLSVSCNALRVTSTIQFNCHCLLIYFVDNFDEDKAVTLKQAFEQIRAENAKGLLKFVPLNIEVLFNMCEQLNDRGHILFLKNQTEVEDSWIIIDKSTLLSEVTGKLFAPNDFKQHCKLASSTGVVPLSEIVDHFPKYSSDMLINFFSHLEFCSEISDEEVLDLIELHQSQNIIDITSTDVAKVRSTVSPQEKSNERYFLFPGLITINRPDNIWRSDSQFTFQCGWMLQCSLPTQFFSSYFLKVLLLRVAFSYALTLHREELDPRVPSLQRKCFIWRNGIFWADHKGVQVVVEVSDHKIVIILIRSLRMASKCFQIRSSLIQTVLKAVINFCPKLPTTELYTKPMDTLHYPLDPPASEITSFSISEIATSIKNSEPAVVAIGENYLIEDLLTFEPYTELSPGVLCTLFNGNKQNEKIMDDFLIEFAHSFCGKKSSHDKLTILQQCLNINESEQESRMNPVHRCLLLLQTWKKKHKTIPILQDLRRVLDQHSVFGGRNPIELGGFGSSSITHSDTDRYEGTDRGARETDREENLKKQRRMEEMMKYQGQTNATAGSFSMEFRTSSQFFDLDDLGFLMESICQAAPQWYYIGLQLGVHPTDLDIISHNVSLLPDSPKSFLREMLKTWLCLASLQAGSLPALLSALKSETVRENRLAKSMEKTSMAYLKRKYCLTQKEEEDMDEEERKEAEQVEKEEEEEEEEEV